LKEILCLREEVILLLKVEQDTSWVSKETFNFMETSQEQISTTPSLNIQEAEEEGLWEIMTMAVVATIT
tara:strand:+ start:650 stop:856 length:207 start_codon:yes stop_codon:yes gene_type:complete